MGDCRNHQAALMAQPKLLKQIQNLGKKSQQLTNNIQHKPRFCAILLKTRHTKRKSAQK